MKSKDLSLMLAHPLFHGSEQTLLEEILSSDPERFVNVASGEIFFSPTTSSNTAGILLEGRAEVLTPDPTRPTLLRQLGAGDLFGITNLFSGEPFISVIRAKSSVRICYLYDSDVRALMERDSEFLGRYLSFLSGRIRFLNRKIGYLTAGSAERRLALYLASYESNEIELASSISALSELLDVGRASLYRAFDRLTADGYLQKHGKHLLLCDREAMLRAYQ